MSRRLKLTAAGGALLFVGLIVFWRLDFLSKTYRTSAASQTAPWQQIVRQRSASSLISELEAYLNTLSASEGTRQIREMLDSGLDLATNQPFKIGPGGNLTSVPTLRVWLLDQFGRRSAVEAAAYSSRIYETSISADEWALALRNDWRIAVQSGRIPEVRKRVLDLLSNSNWAGNPTIGFLEAFDVAVASMAWEAIPRFERWVTDGKSRALLNGSWLALDRLAQEAPTDFTAQIVEHSEWLGSQPKLRAGLMARANIAVEAERKAVETYLQRSDLSDSEASRFFDLFPNVSGSFSHNLVTEPRIISSVEAANRDKAALMGVREWLNRTEYRRWRSYLISAESRLVEACASASRGGLLMP